MCTQSGPCIESTDTEPNYTSTQCNSLIDGNLNQTVSTSLPSFAKQIIYTYIHTWHEIPWLKSYNYKIKFIHA